MKLSSIRKSVLFMMAACLCVATVSVGAQGFPAKNKAITLIVGFSAGGSSDAGARILAGGMEKVLGTKVEVLNKPGASGQIAYTMVAQAKPDGYTFGLASLPGIMVSIMDADRKAAYKKDDFQPIGLQVLDAGVLAVKADSPYKTVKDLVDDAKARPRKITVSTTGLQTGDHLAVLQLQQYTGTQYAMVHFDGAGTAMTALLGKKVDVYSGNIGDVLSQLKSGDIRVLGVMDTEQSPFLPGVKTFEEQGIPLLGGSWRGYLAPAGTPKEIVEKLSAAMKTALETEEVKSAMAKLGLQIRYLDVKGYTKVWDDYGTMVKDLIPLSKK
jgi:tripartite-type tricarboxylate transporter receptor subunit TctC